jgi:hypothetical protein
LPHIVRITTFVRRFFIRQEIMKHKGLIILSFMVVVCLAFTVRRSSTQKKEQNQIKMKVAVWDTYVPAKDGRVMHFDIIAPAGVRDTVKIYAYGREYLRSKGQEGQPLTSKECRFCHVRDLSPQWEAEIRKKGYYILEMENCN